MKVQNTYEEIMIWTPWKEYTGADRYSKEQILYQNVSIPKNFYCKRKIFLTHKSMEVHYIQIFISKGHYSDFFFIPKGHHSGSNYSERFSFSWTVTILQGHYSRRLILWTWGHNSQIRNMKTTTFQKNDLLE